MRAIVPLAGPDFVTDTYGVKPLIDIEGEPLVKHAITTRAWWRSGRLKPTDIVFVLRDVPEAALVRQRLADWFPGSQTVLLSRVTAGALLSALAGAALLPADDAPLVVDLVDILFDIDDAALDGLSRPGVGAAAPWFTDTCPAYSYFELDEQGEVLRAREKLVISSNASAGTYFFSNMQVFVAAAAFALQHAEQLTYKGAHFVCPALNGVVANGLRVLGVPATNIRPVSKLFHE